MYPLEGGRWKVVGEGTRKQERDSEGKSESKLKREGAYFHSLTFTTALALLSSLHSSNGDLSQARLSVRVSPSRLQALSEGLRDCGPMNNIADSGECR